MLSFKGFNYIGFEPSPFEYNKLVLNTKPNSNYQIALSKNSGEDKFYISSE